ncbi:MAG TPA: hypothetical protein VHL80_13705 [Polyangia bacterium]|nr:hypothetical protein [Polyangia bacterium]
MLRAAAIACALLAALSTSGCASHALEAGGGDAAAGADGAAGTAGSAADGPCPATPPLTGDVCTVPALDCEWGDDPNPFCHTIAFCSQGQWAVNPLSNQCPSTRAASCPPSLEAARGAACAEMGAWCTWQPGTTCHCTNCRPGPVGDACSGDPTWYCAQSATGCPSGVPALGSPCAPDQLYCEYGCDFGGRRCVSGVWAFEVSPCPMSTRAVKQDIRYLSPPEIDELATKTNAIRLASYRYRGPQFGSPGQRLGFIIEDNPDLPAVSPGGRTVDLYGFASMLLATSQVQARRIETLEREVAALRRSRERAARPARSGSGERGARGRGDLAGQGLGARGGAGAD